MAEPKTEKGAPKAAKKDAKKDAKPAKGWRGRVGQGARAATQRRRSDFVAPTDYVPRLKKHYNEVVRDAADQAIRLQECRLKCR